MRASVAVCRRRGGHRARRTRSLSVFSGKLAAPMVGDIDAAAEPYPIEAAHMFEQLDQSAAASRPADETVMQADREQLRRTVAALAVEKIERVAHVGEKIVAGGKAAVFIETIIVFFVQARNDGGGRVPAAAQIRKFTRERIAIEKKPAGRAHEP